jgi:hypothetical protein
MQFDTVSKSSSNGSRNVSYDVALQLMQLRMGWSKTRVDRSSTCETSGSHGDEYEDDRLLGCATCEARWLIADDKAVSAFETPVNFYETTRRNIREDSSLTV